VGAAVQFIDAGHALKAVSPAAAEEMVVAAVAEEHVVVIGAVDRFDRRVVTQAELEIGVVDGVVRTGLAEVDPNAVGHAFEVEDIVVAVGGFVDRIGAEIGAGESVSVTFGATIKRIVAAPALKPVLTALTVQMVLAAIAEDRVASCAALDVFNAQ